jgi:hypothetical protein
MALGLGNTPTRSLSCELHARLPSPGIQMALKLTETVSLKSIKSHFQRNVRGAPCNASIAVLRLPGVYRNAYPSIVTIDRAVMISGGHPCRASRPDSASSNLPPTSCNKAMPWHLRHRSGADARIVYSIDGRVLFHAVFLASTLPRSHQCRIFPALAPSSPPSSMGRP